MHSEDSVSFKVLKGKYFPDSSPRRVVKCSSSSFLWSSLLEGKKVVEEGAFWRVGDGKQIEVWDDAWLDKPQEFRATRPSQTPTPLKVAALINEEDRSWKMDIVKDLFTEMDASIITSIQLSNRSIPDKQIWRESSTGMFTVKSAYFYARKVLGKENHLLNHRRHYWRIFWSAKTMPRVKVFVWRLVHEIIPSGFILQKRGLAVENKYTVCGQPDDSLRHIFLRCILSEAVWELCAPEVLSVWESFWNDTEMWDKFLKWLLSKQLVEIWMYVVWLLWNNKNECYHRSSCKTPAGIAQTAIRLVSNFLQVSCTIENTDQRILERWTPPAQDCFKLNVDAAYYPRLKVASLGMVIRNASGTFCLCGVKKIDKVDSPLQAELMAIAFGLEIAKENLFSSISVESDSLQAIQEIWKNHKSFCLWECIIANISDLSLVFDFCNFTHIRRSANGCAHNAAKLPCDLGNCIVWRNTTPPSLCNPDFSME